MVYAGRAHCNTMWRLSSLGVGWRGPNTMPKGGRATSALFRVDVSLGLAQAQLLCTRS